MDQSTFATFIRCSADLLDRRSLFGGASAALLAATGLPLAAEAKKKGKRKRRRKHKKSKSCKLEKQCRQSEVPECNDTPEIPNCENRVKKCCEKACESVDEAVACIEDLG